MIGEHIGKHASEETEEEIVEEKTDEKESQTANILAALKSTVAVPNSELKIPFIGGSIMVGRPPSRFNEALEQSVIVAPDMPHIYLVDKITLPAIPERNIPETVLENVVMLHGHGRRESVHHWYFGGNISVIDTAWGYNQFAEKEGLPPIGFISSCSSTSRVVESVRENLSGKMIPTTVEREEKVLPARANWLPGVIMPSWGLHYSACYDEDGSLHAKVHVSEGAVYIKVVSQTHYQIVGTDQQRSFEQRRSGSIIFVGG